MRAGWNEHEINAPDARAHGRGCRRGGGRRARPDGRAVLQRRIGLVADRTGGREPSSIPVFGSGDCVEPGADRRSGWRAHVSAACWSAAARCAIRGSSRRRRPRSAASRRSRSRSTSADSSCSTTSICCWPSASTKRPDSVTRRRATRPPAPPAAARGRERWVINKLRALGSWYTKGLEGGGQLRVAINSSESIGQLRETIGNFFCHRKQPLVQTASSV